MTLVVSAIALGCAPSGRGAGEQTNCPPEALVGELHAAAFYFQHGPAHVGRSHLTSASMMDTLIDSSAAHALLVRLEGISARLDREPEWAQLETDRVRSDFTDWACLPERLHGKFHEQLPPIE